MAVNRTASGRDSGNTPPEELRRMQEDAVRRVHEMQNRARSHLHPSEPAPPSRKSQESPQKQQSRPVPAPEPASLPPASPCPPSSASVTELLMKDPERTLILALLMVLGGENADPELMFALLFLLL